MLVCHISTNQTPLFYTKTMANENFFEGVYAVARDSYGKVTSYGAIAKL
jgi:O6-methylguanine-DNA--protein-cysteine methyltransferase